MEGDSETEAEGAALSSMGGCVVTSGVVTTVVSGLWVVITVVSSGAGVVIAVVSGTVVASGVVETPVVSGDTVVAPGVVCVATGESVGSVVATESTGLPVGAPENGGRVTPPSALVGGSVRGGSGMGSMTGRSVGASVTG